jgi:hypothetical protein
MFSILGHKGNANQNYIENPLHHSQIGNYQKMLVRMRGGGKKRSHSWWEWKPVQPLQKSV